MKKDRSTVKILNDKKESREISKTILDFGVTEEQKIDIMINLALSLENNANMKEIVSFLKKFTINFNTEEKENNINVEDKKTTNSNKIILD